MAMKMTMKHIRKHIHTCTCTLPLQYCKGDKKEIRFYSSFLAKGGILLIISFFLGCLSQLQQVEIKNIRTGMRIVEEEKKRK